MGKSIRSKIKRKWRSKKRAEVNKPMEDESLRQTTWRLQKNLKNKLAAEKATAGTVANLANILSGKQNTVTEDSTVKSVAPAYVSNPEAEKLWGLSCGSAIGEKRPFSFVERTWEVERPPPGYQLEHFSELISEKLKQVDKYPSEKNEDDMDCVEMKRGHGKAATAKAARAKAKKRRRKISSAPYKKKGNNYGRKAKGICCR